MLQILKKLKERSLLNYYLVQNVSFLYPEIVASKEATILNFNSLAGKFSKFGWISCEEAGDTNEQYKEFVYGDHVKFSEKFEKN